jgi:hypothetical protein
VCCEAEIIDTFNKFVKSFDDNGVKKAHFFNCDSFLTLLPYNCLLY